MPRKVTLMPLQMALVQEMGEPAPGTFGAVMRTLSRKFRGNQADINKKLAEYGGVTARTAQRWSSTWRTRGGTRAQRAAGNANKPSKKAMAGLLAGSGLDIYVRRLDRLEQQGAKVRIRATFDFDGPMGDRPINARHRTIGAHELVEIAPEFWWLRFCAAWREGEVGQGRQLCQDNPARNGACDFFQEAFWDAMGGYSGCAEIYDVEFIEIYEGATAQRRPA